MKNKIKENEMKLEFISKSNNEAFARISVAAFVSQLDPTIEEITTDAGMVSGINYAEAMENIANRYKNENIVQINLIEWQDSVFNLEDIKDRFKDDLRE